MEKLTFFIDLDGTLVEMINPFDDVIRGKIVPRELPNCASKLLQWHCEGHIIILVTGRPDCMRRQTENFLADCGMVYDQLIMGVGAGPRILINDVPEDAKYIKAHSINIPRDKGIGDVEIFTGNLKI